MRLARVQKDGKTLEGRIQSLKQDEERWEARDRRVADGGLAPFIALLSGLALVARGYLARQRLMLGTGVVLLLAGLAEHALHLFGAFDWTNWGLLAGLGVATILLSSVLERHGSRLRAGLNHWRKDFREWQL